MSFKKDLEKAISFYKERLQKSKIDACRRLYDKVIKAEEGDTDCQFYIVWLYRWADAMTKNIHSQTIIKK